MVFGSMIITIGGTVACLLKNKLRKYRWLWKTVKTAKIVIGVNNASIVKTATIVIGVKNALTVFIVKTAKSALTAKSAYIVFIVKTAKIAL